MTEDDEYRIVDDDEGKGPSGMFFPEDILIGTCFSTDGKKGIALKLDDLEVILTPKTVKHLIKDLKKMLHVIGEDEE